LRTKLEGIGVASCVLLKRPSLRSGFPLGTTLLSLLVPERDTRVQGVIALRRKLSWLPHIGSLPYGHEESDKACRLLGSPPHNPGYGGGEPSFRKLPSNSRFRAMPPTSLGAGTNCMVVTRTKEGGSTGGGRTKGGGERTGSGHGPGARSLPPSAGLPESLTSLRSC
jgi:hypothetical protein